MQNKTKIIKKFLYDVFIIENYFHSLVTQFINISKFIYIYIYIYTFICIKLDNKIIKNILYFISL